MVTSLQFDEDELHEMIRLILIADEAQDVFKDRLTRRVEHKIQAAIDTIDANRPRDVRD